MARQPKVHCDMIGNAPCFSMTFVKAEDKRSMHGCNLSTGPVFLRAMSSTTLRHADAAMSTSPDIFLSE
eukprot:m.211243 g.211243  ORF g.211243 m.211243 type:complete len:69 (-) comp10138_c5_seq32:15-221(-)